MHQVVADFKPTVTVIDPVTNLMTVGTYADVQAMLTRLIDHLKTENITAMLTSLMPGQTEIERTETTISSLMDTWIVLANDEIANRHRRGLYVLKSRGMAHSNERCEFVLTDDGLKMLGATGTTPETSTVEYVPRPEPGAGPGCDSSGWIILDDLLQAAGEIDS
jgi:circadian clock protein KaiC